MRKLFLSTLLISTSGLFALPIDWHGSFGVDSIVIGNFNRLTNTNQSVTPIPVGSQEVESLSGGSTASFQSYVFRLSPTIIVNDSASVIAEFTSGLPYGGRLGDDPVKSEGASNFDNSLYYLNTSGNTQLLVKQLYMELYSDTATWQIGRYTADWGVGAIVNSGKGAWDRYSFIRDGITANMKFSNFKFTPYWAIIDSATSLTRGPKITEKGISVLYENTERDIALGIFYSVRDGGNETTNLEGIDGGPLGKTDVTLLDLYMKKNFGDFSFTLEFPLFSGKLGNVYGPTQESNYKAKAILLEADYQINNKWSVIGKAGTISGDDGESSSFGALYLNPNYQIAKLIGRYNFKAISNPGQYGVYDSYLTNMRYAGIYGNYKTDRYLFKSAIIMASALEVATAGNVAYNHLTNKAFTANTNQANDMGVELDLGMDYLWNKEITLNLDLAYHFVGDYYTFSNDAANLLKTQNTWLLGLGANVAF